jgi:site-specific DNA recombinase
MLADLRAGVVDGVLAVDQDRLTRRLSDLGKLLEVCEARNASVLLLSGEIDSTTADGRLRAQILGSVAEHESAKKSERELRQRDQAARQGRYQGGRRPYGYDSDGVTVRKDEAKVVREIARRYIRGDSLHSIALDLNRRELKPTGSEQWRVTTLRSLIGSPRLAGLRVHRGEVIGVAVWRPILSMDEHAAIVERLGDVRRPRTGRPETAVLSNILRCSRCGCGMVAGTRSGGGRRYTCFQAPGHKGCGGMAIEATKTEGYVTELVLAALDDSEIPKPSNSNRERDVELADIADREQVLSRMYASGELAQHEWVAARRELGRRRDALGALVIARRPPTILFGRRSVRRAWPDMSQAERREVISFVVDSIDVLPAAVPRWDPARLADPVWRI